MQDTGGKQNRELHASLAQPATARAEQHKQLIVPVTKSDRAGKGKRKIRTYNLFHDPVFKLAGAVTNHSQLAARSGAAAPAFGVLGSGYNYSVPAGMPAGMIMGGAIKSTRAESGAPALKMESAVKSAETGGLEFACREKAFTPSYIRRDMSACYQSSLDKSWRARTFVSKATTDGGREWGGGLSVIYEH